MRVDIITLHAIKNYGSVLQALATQRLFEEFGFDVTIINYIRHNVTNDELPKTICGNNPVKRIVLLPTLKKWKKVFDGFINMNLNLTEKCYSTLEDFDSYSSDADVFCTGSDQVWNSTWNRGIEYPLYLSFVPDNKLKIAFAASFGKNELEDDEVQKTREYIEKYKYISVRESAAVNILKNQYKYKNDVIQLLDPTLSMESSFWRRYAEPYNIDGDYILIYNLNRSREFDDYARKLSKITGLKAVRICYRYDQLVRYGKSVIIPSVGQFIYLIDHAKYVLTDSFHATAFSFNMNTEPICIYPKEFSSRIDSFLDVVESKQRHVESFDDYDVINRPVNFEMVNNILEEERKKTRDFIRLVTHDAENIERNCDNEVE